jgi:hypothetical protein
MVIYLTHPLHGAKVATMDIEADADEANGWTRYNPEQVESEPVNELGNKRKYTRKAVEPEGV